MIVGARQPARLCSVSFRRNISRALFATDVAPPNAKPRVLIVGNGIAGLTLALTLQRHGITPQILSDPRGLKPKTQGLMLPVNAMVILKELGLADRVQKAGTVLTEHLVTRYGTRDYGRLNLAKLQDRYGAPAVGIDKAALVKILESSLDVQATRTQFSLEHEKGKQQVRVEFKDPRRGTYQEYFDVVVGAEGIHSKIRKDLFGIDNRPGNFAFCGCIIPRPPSVNPSTVTDIWGFNQRIHMVPLGKRDGKDQLFVWGWYIPEPTTTAQTVAGRQRDFVVQFRKAGFNNLGVPDVLDQILKLPPEEISPQLADFVVPGRHHFHLGRFALIGDAAHGFVPGIHQGAAMAIEDGFALGGLLHYRSHDLPSALELYDNTRREQVGLVENLAMRDMMDAFSSGSSFRNWLQQRWLKWRLSSGSLTQRYGKLAKRATNIVALHQPSQWPDATKAAASAAKTAAAPAQPSATDAAT